MINSHQTKLIEYRFLNMDTEKFVLNHEKLIEEVGQKGLVRVIANHQTGQVLFAASKEEFGEVDAIQLSRKISGLNRFGEKEKP